MKYVKTFEHFLNASIELHEKTLNGPFTAEDIKKLIKKNSDLEILHAKWNSYWYVAPYMIENGKLPGMTKYSMPVSDTEGNIIDIEISDIRLINLD